MAAEWLAGGRGRHERGACWRCRHTTSVAGGDDQRPVRRPAWRTGAGARCRSTRPAPGGAGCWACSVTAATTGTRSASGGSDAGPGRRAVCRPASASSTRQRVPATRTSPSSGGAGGAGAHAIGQLPPCPGCGAAAQHGHRSGAPVPASGRRARHEGISQRHRAAASQASGPRAAGRRETAAAPRSPLGSGPAPTPTPTATPPPSRPAGARPGDQGVQGIPVDNQGQGAPTPAGRVRKFSLFRAGATARGTPRRRHRRAISRPSPSGRRPRTPRPHRSTPQSRT
jgi:hypothetical protein